MCLSPLAVKKLHSMPMKSMVSPRLPAGSTPSVTAKAKISNSPIQKVGTEKPSTEIAMMSLDTLACGA